MQHQHAFGPGISRLNGPPAETPPSLSNRKSPTVAKVAQKLPDQRVSRSLKGQAANENALQSLRVEKVGDVLSGGL